MTSSQQTSSPSPADLLNQAEALIQQAIVAMKDAKPEDGVDFIDALHMLMPVTENLCDVIAQVEEIEEDAR